MDDGSTENTSSEEQRMILTPLRFAKEFTNIWPQIRRNGHFNYFFAGSLATNILMHAKNIQDVGSSKAIPITPEIRRLFVTNKIKDIDIAYSPDHEVWMDDVFSKEFEKFERCIQKYRSISASPKGMGLDLALEESSINTRYKVVTTDGNEFYIVGLDAMIAHKLVSLVRVHRAYPETANAQIESIYKAATSVYGTEHIKGVIIGLFKFYRKYLKHYNDLFGTLETVASELDTNKKISPFVKNLFSLAVKSSQRGI
ncbi:hypothetical protein A2397_05400 [Candidatus Amesbacteria bacterium RIFOXYB1_FULL_44_23]|uniref:Uncharacterized protein n=1 Tax=Candidatus Amesbacteria bacterium RIFOXYB1_FULL_44_23 TaxID=1797263 RepID=A0A1F4ZR56_9BACT|nr:MAG: hypothetical protein A2397_05400 [Candidatus Amesbacteria bacterium RIFOXYB1_FULL_44_23]